MGIPTRPITGYELSMRSARKAPARTNKAGWLSLAAALCAYIPWLALFFQELARNSPGQGNTAGAMSIAAAHTLLEPWSYGPVAVIASVVLGAVAIIAGFISFAQSTQAQEARNSVAVAGILFGLISLAPACIQVIYLLK